MRRARRSANAPTRRFVIWWYRALVTGFFGVVAITMSSMLAPALPNPTAATLLLVGLGPALFVTVRSARSATIEFRDDEVLLYELLRTKRIPWSRVREVGATGGSTLMLAWRVPYFQLDDGSTVRADEVRSLREPSIVDDVVAEGRRRLRTA